MEILGEHKILLLHRAIPFVWKLREITAEQQVQGYLLTDTDGLPFPSTTELSKTTKLWSCGQKWRCSVFWTWREEDNCLPVIHLHWNLVLQSFTVLRKTNNNTELLWTSLKSLEFPVETDIIDITSLPVVQYSRFKLY